MGEDNAWWTLDNHLLVHALNINGRTKGDYEKDTEKPFPEKGEVNGSIMSPATRNSYASSGLILAPTTPIRMRYRDAGSYVPSGVDPGTAPREAKAEMFTPEQLSMEMLVYLTLANTFYNEVHVDAADTKIIGVYTRAESVDSFVEGLGKALESGDPAKYEMDYCRAMGNAAAQSEVFLNKGNNFERAEVTWGFHDSLRPSWQKFGYEFFDQFANALTAGEIEFDDVLKGLEREKLFGGEFELWPVTEEHRAYLKERL